MSDRLKTLVCLTPYESLGRLNRLVHNALAGILGPSRTLHMMVTEPNCAPGADERMVAAVMKKNPDGVLFWFPDPVWTDVIEALVARGIPVASVNRDFSGIGAISVVGKVDQVALKLFDAAWNQGKRRFAVISCDRPSPSIREFAKTICDAAEQRSFDTSCRHLLLPYAAYERPSDQMVQQLSHFMEADLLLPDAVITAERFSFRTFEVWLARNPDLRVPQDIAVSTFDPMVPTVARLQGIPMAALDYHAMLARSVALLEQAQSGQPVEPLLQYVPADLITSMQRFEA